MPEGHTKRASIGVYLDEPCYRMIDNWELQAFKLPLAMVRGLRFIGGKTRSP